MMRTSEDEYKDRGKNSTIIADTLNANARSSGIDENGSEMDCVVDAFQKINNALNSSYTLIHHTGKDETKGMRGHTSVHASKDTILYVQKKDSGCTWSLEKLKEGEDGISY
ncbi:MAG: RecA-family ATPase [Methylophilaceae bacterium]|jgi:RecA-family ATPase